FAEPVFNAQGIQVARSFSYAYDETGDGAEAEYDRADDQRGDRFVSHLLRITATASTASSSVVTRNGIASCSIGWRSCGLPSASMATTAGFCSAYAQASSMIVPSDGLARSSRLTSSASQRFTSLKSRVMM